MGRRLALLACAGLLAIPATASAADGHAIERGSVSRAKASDTLQQAKALRAGRGVRTGRELSPVLRELALALPALSGAQRREAEAILARPTDAGDSDFYGPFITSVATTCSAGFCFHWTENPGSPDAPPDADNDPATIPAFVQQMTSVFQDEVFPCENGTAAGTCSGGDGLGWAAAPGDAGRGGDNRLDVYLVDVGAQGIFGYNATDPGQSGRSRYSYMVMDNDYDPGQYGGANATDSMRVTAAHEYNHALQNGYDTVQDTWMFESTATWAEEKVYANVNDWLRYLAPWRALRDQPITAFPRDADGSPKPESVKVYGSALWNHWLEGRYGAGVMRSAWEQSAAPPQGFQADFAADAYSVALGRANAFSEEFARFAAGAAEWRVPAVGWAGTGDTAAFADMPRSAGLPAGTEASGLLDNTTFALFDVPVPAAGTPVALMFGTVPQGMRGAIALVGRRGGDTEGPVTTELADLPTGGEGVVGLADPGSYSRITAVVVNADVTLSGFDSLTGEWTYARDNQSYTARSSGPLAPAVTSGDGTPLTPSTATLTGAVNPLGQDATWFFEYGKTIAYGSKTPAQPLARSTAAQPVSAPVAGLASSTDYHFRLVAGNATGTAAGADRTFTTLVDRLAPTLRLGKLPSVVRRKRVAAGLRVRFTIDEAAAVTGKLVLARSVAKRIGLRSGVLSSRRVRVSRAGAGRLVLKPSAKVRRALRRLRGTARMTLVVSAVDQAGNRARPQMRRLKLKP